jgi:hypothetical protein
MKIRAPSYDCSDVEVRSGRFHTARVILGRMAVGVMSGLPPIATVERTSRFGSFVPTTEVARLFDHLVGSAVSEAWLALPNFYNISIRIANVAARLAVLVLWLCDKLGSSISP